MTTYAPARVDRIMLIVILGKRILVQIRTADANNSLARLEGLMVFL